MRKANTYWVDWYRDDWCYRSTHGVTWEKVKEMKKTAKMLGETIKYTEPSTVIILEITYILNIYINPTLPPLIIPFFFKFLVAI